VELTTQFYSSTVASFQQTVGFATRSMKKIVSYFGAVLYTHTTHTQSSTKSNCLYKTNYYLTKSGLKYFSSK